MKGWGQKRSTRPSKPGKSNFFGGISRDFAGISRKCPKSLRKKVCAQILAPIKGWFWRMYPRSGFRSGGTCECTLLPVFAPGEHANVPSFRFFPEAPAILFLRSDHILRSDLIFVLAGKCENKIGSKNRSDLKNKIAGASGFVPGEHPPRPPFWKPPF